MTTFQHYHIMTWSLFLVTMMLPVLVGSRFTILAHALSTTTTAVSHSSTIATTTSSSSSFLVPFSSPPKFQTWPELDAFAQGDIPLATTCYCKIGGGGGGGGGSVGVAAEPSLSLETLQFLKRDASCLQQVGYGSIAGVASQTEGIRTGVHQIWLQSPRHDGEPSSSSSPSSSTILVGYTDARKELFRWVASLRQHLDTYHRQQQQQQQCSSSSRISSELLPEMVELSYLLYPSGAYYRKHVDHIQKSSTKKREQKKSNTSRSGVATHYPNSSNLQAHTSSSPSRRTVSFVLYLGDPTEEKEDEDSRSPISSSPSTSTSSWDCTTDGGALRVYGDAAFYTGHAVNNFPSRNDRTSQTNDENNCIATKNICYSDNDEGGDEIKSLYYSDIPPTPGTVVLFDSSTVAHEVLMTHRPRAAVVGWFRSKDHNDEAGDGEEYELEISDNDHDDEEEKKGPTITI